jgi:N6-L-threonylcarbamoyladenine synthase
LALAKGKPLIAVNHLAGHALTARLTDGVAFPFLLLLVSGGHCQLLAVAGPQDYRLYGTTMDDAVGEAFDKTAKILGLPYPGGPNVEIHAARGNGRAYPLPRPLLGRAGMDFSFSGLKTAVRQLAARAPTHAPVHVDDACASFQAAAIDILSDRTQHALARFRRDFPARVRPMLVVAGGVAANAAIGAALAELAKSHDFDIRVPPAKYCTDNAAMIAWAGLERFALGKRDPLDFSPRARWPLDESADSSHSGQRQQGA